MKSLGIELLQSHREQSPEAGDFVGDVPPTAQTRKRQLDATSEGDLFSEESAINADEYTAAWSCGRESRACSPGIISFAHASHPLMEEITQKTRQEPKSVSLTRPDVSSINARIKRLERVSPATRLRKRQVDGADNEY